MKLHILSDLHIEFEPFTWPGTDADLVILAGDIHVGEKGLQWIFANIPDKKVIYVPGNHEYYGKAIPKHTEKLKKLAAGTNVFILENEKCVLDGMVFLGCTLWTDLQLFGNRDAVRYEAESRMTDYRRIKHGPKFRKLQSIDTMNFFSRSLVWLTAELANHRQDKVIVVTHHAPSAQSIPEIHKQDMISAAYASNLESFIRSNNIALWVHGHMHVNRDYRIRNTRVLCNAKGYPDEKNSDFNPGFVVEV
ncbi:MAG: phosphoesterase [Desulfobacteraceae bacterium]|nr:MAG: phosphoesterase [Desulfobacteraceae bacterium]